MSMESLTNSASNASSSNATDRKQLTLSAELNPLSDSIQDDLKNSTSQLSKKAATSCPDSQQNQKATSAQAIVSMTTNSLATDSAQDSPTKSSPSKSRSKRRNEAKKRSANNKKRQSTQDKDQSSQPPQQKHETPTDFSTNAITEMTPSMSDQEQRKEYEFSETQHNADSRSISLGITNQQDFKQQESISANNGPCSQIELPSTNNETVESNQTESPHHNSQSNNAASKQASNTRSSHDTNSWRRKQRENLELNDQIRLRDSQLQNLAERVKQQINKIKELEASLVSTTRTCGQFEKLLKQELTNRTRLETENESLKLTVARLRNQVNVHEKDRSANNELIRVLNATLMERETEVSILKLKMTRMQTKAPASRPTEATSSCSLSKQDPCKAFTMSGRSNSEFSRNSLARSSVMSEAAVIRSSATQLQQNEDRDASVWASVPEELTPSKRPLVLERNFGPIYSHVTSMYYDELPLVRNQSSTPFVRDRRYKTLPKSMKTPLPSEKAIVPSSSQTQANKSLVPTEAKDDGLAQPTYCLITNLDESNNTSRSSDNKSAEAITTSTNEFKIIADARNNSKYESDSEFVADVENIRLRGISENNGLPSKDESYYASIDGSKPAKETHQIERSSSLVTKANPPTISPPTPVKSSFGLKKILDKFRRTDLSVESSSKVDICELGTPLTHPSPFQRGATRSTIIGATSNIRSQLSPRSAAEFHTNKPFAEWDTNMLVDWLTMIGLSMYANQCRRWVKCGAHIMNATTAEVDKGLGITNHLHRKKLRLAISELNGDCDKITKAAAKLDYLWVARWLDDIGLPQYKEAFINGRVDGRVLNYLTIEDLVSLGVKSLLHHSSIKSGIKVLRSINFDLQLLKRRATADEIEQMSSIRQSMDEQIGGPSEQSMKISDQDNIKVRATTEVPLWTCHRVMEWLRMIDFAEFAPNLRGSGVHGGLIIYEDAFNNDTMSTLLSIPNSRTLLRRHLSTFFKDLVGEDLTQRKLHYQEQPTSRQLNPSAEIKAQKKSQLWFGKKSSKAGQDGMDEYLCPMYPVEPQLVKSSTRKPETRHRECSNLPRIPESINI